MSLRKNKFLVVVLMSACINVFQTATNALLNLDTLDNSFVNYSLM